MTQSQVKKRKHKLKRHLFLSRLALAGLASLTTGALALTASQVQADENSQPSVSDSQVSLTSEPVESREVAQQSLTPSAETARQEEAPSQEVDLEKDKSLDNLTNSASQVSGPSGQQAAEQKEVEQVKPDSESTEEKSSRQSSELDSPAPKRASVAHVATAASNSLYTLPVQGPVSAGFNGYPGHGGIDYAVPEGTPVHAARDGLVKVASSGHPWMGWQGGNAILLQHPDGMHTGYAHLSRFAVGVGDQVKQGQIIGYSGSTGLVTGPHLHFEMLPANPNFSNGYSGRIDPTAYMANAPFKAAPSPIVNRYNVDALSKEVGQTLSDGDYHIVLAANPQYGVDAAGAGQTNGTNIQLYQNRQDAKQVFSITYLGNGFYKIAQKSSGRVLDVAKGSKDNGTNVQLWEDNGSSAQQWIIKQSSGNNNYEVISRNGGLALDVPGAAFANNSNLQVYSPNGSPAQKFRFLAVDKDAKGTLVDGDYRIVSALDNKLGLDVAGASDKNNANVQIYPNTNDNRQIFHVKYLNNGYYQITAKHSGKALDNSGDGTYNGNNIVLYDANSSSAQQWLIKPSQFVNHFEIFSKEKNKLVDVTGGSAKANTNVQLYIDNGSKSQAWRFIPVKKD